MSKRRIASMGAAVAVVLLGGCGNPTIYGTHPTGDARLAPHASAACAPHSGVRSFDYWYAVCLDGTPVALNP